MALRAGMADIITRLRLLVNDPAGASAVFTDQQLQDWLDQQRIEVRYQSLRGAETYASGGAVTYKVFYADVGPWEISPTLVSSTYATVTPATSDLLVGRFEFAADQNGNLPIRISGYVYNLYGAAVMTVETWLSVLRSTVDVSMDNLSKKSSQSLTNLQKLLDEYRQRASSWPTGVAANEDGPGSGRWLNTDMNPWSCV